jgi:hypothetical protein
MPKMLPRNKVLGETAEWVQARYIQVYSATMGNHSLARYYCHWTLEEYEAKIQEFPKFEAAIREESMKIADRAKYLLYEGLGLMSCNEEEPVTNTQAINTLARISEELRERGADEIAEAEQKKSRGIRRSVLVEGLKRPDSPPVPPVS